MRRKEDQGQEVRWLLLHPSDNTATALADLQAGEAISLERCGPHLTVTLLEPIPFAHKFAIDPIPRGGEVRKHGEVIGEASQDIRPGELVHVHNVVGRRSRGGKE